MLPQLTPYWPGRELRYVEPFAGSACFYFAAQPTTALLGDINPHLIRTYQALKSKAAAVYDEFISIPRDQENYYRIRKSGFDVESDVTAAARFIYLNRNCFNGLYRTNRSGDFNVPFSDKRTGSYPDRESFLRAASDLERAEVICADFETVLNDHVRSGDFVYLDPPYAVRNVRTFTQYGPDTFGLGDLERLRASLHMLDNLGVPFLLSYADCPEARDIFSPWESSSASVQRHISGFSTFRRASGELIVRGKHTATSVMNADG